MNSGKVIFKRNICVTAVVDWNCDLLAHALHLTAESSNCDVINLFVFQTPGTLNHKESMTLDGRKTMRSLFGYAMAVAGDLNRDGFTGRRQKLSLLERKSNVTKNRNGKRGKGVWNRKYSDNLHQNSKWRMTTWKKSLSYSLRHAPFWSRSWEHSAWIINEGFDEGFLTWSLTSKF